MLKRKINAVLGFLVTVLILNHAILISAWMLSKGSIAEPADIFSWVLMGLTILHALISIDIAISSHMESGKTKGKMYPKMNVSTIVQRASGVLMVPTMALHVAGTVGLTQPPPIVHATLPPVFFTVVMVHVAVSTSKSLITLGIGSAKFLKIADIIVKVLCAATLIASVTGFYLYVV